MLRGLIVAQWFVYFGVKDMKITKSQVNTKRIAFYTFISDDYYYPVGTHKMVNSFRRFHPDIDLIVFRDDVIKKVFAEKKINFYMAKPTFAKLLTDKYDLICNIDADTIITDRLECVLKGDYEVGCAWNYNLYENASFENIEPQMYLQAGLVASTSKKFWDEWEEKNRDAMKYLRQENDVLNKVVYGDGKVPKYKLKIFDKDYGYIGCKSLGLEERFYVENGKLMCNKEPIWAYHHAKGKDFPKLQFERMGFTWQVQRFLEEVATSGQSIKISHV